MRALAYGKINNNIGPRSLGLGPSAQVPGSKSPGPRSASPGPRSQVQVPRPMSWVQIGPAPKICYGIGTSSWLLRTLPVATVCFLSVSPILRTSYWKSTGHTKQNSIYTESAFLIYIYIYKSEKQILYKLNFVSYDLLISSKMFSKLATQTGNILLRQEGSEEANWRSRFRNRS